MCSQPGRDARQAELDHQQRSLSSTRSRKARLLTPIQRRAQLRQHVKWAESKVRTIEDQYVQAVLDVTAACEHLDSVTARPDKAKQALIARVAQYGALPEPPEARALGPSRDLGSQTIHGVLAAELGPQSLSKACVVQALGELQEMAASLSLILPDTEPRGVLSNLFQLLRPLKILTVECPSLPSWRTSSASIRRSTSSGKGICLG